VRAGVQHLLGDWEDPIGSCTATAAAAKWPLIQPAVSLHHLLQLHPESSILTRLHIAAQLPTCLMHGALPCWYDVLQDELAKSVTTEQGKTFQDAKGDVFRGLGEFRLSQPMSPMAWRLFSSSCSLSSSIQKGCCTVYIWLLGRRHRGCHMMYM
jgi:hypothetical protein